MPACRFRHSARGGRRTSPRGLTLIETLVLGVVVLALAAWGVFGVRWRSRCGGVSTRLICSANLKGIGTSCKIYANDNHERWPTPAFDESMVGKIDYMVRVGGGEGSRRSPGRTQRSVAGDNGTRQLSVTRAFWMLVRSGDVTPEQFVCPSSFGRDRPPPKLREPIDRYYDFVDSMRVSYGYQVPFGPEATRAHEERDNRMIVAADRGPYRDASVSVPSRDLLSEELTASSPSLETRRPWAPFNSPNHQSEGQNALYMDGHAQFVRMPTVGVDGDNIYTISLGGDAAESFLLGESPWTRSAPPFCWRSPSGSPRSSTDSVIFP